MLKYNSGTASMRFQRPLVRCVIWFSPNSINESSASFGKMCDLVSLHDLFIPAQRCFSRCITSSTLHQHILDLLICSPSNCAVHPFSSSTAPTHLDHIYATRCSLLLSFLPDWVIPALLGITTNPGVHPPPEVGESHQQQPILRRPDLCQRFSDQETGALKRLPFSVPNPVRSVILWTPPLAKVPSSSAS